MHNISANGGRAYCFGMAVGLILCHVYSGPTTRERVITVRLRIGLLLMMSNRVSLAPRWIRERKWRHSLSARYSLLTMGGQSIPNFDYAMAEGVAKSFRSNFLEKLTDAMDEQSGGMRNAEMVKAALEEVEASMRNLQRNFREMSLLA